MLTTYNKIIVQGWKKDNEKRGRDRILGDHLRHMRIKDFSADSLSFKNS